MCMNIHNISVFFYEMINANTLMMQPNIMQPKHLEPKQKKIELHTI